MSHLNRSPAVRLLSRPGALALLAALLLLPIPGHADQAEYAVVREISTEVHRDAVTVRFVPDREGRSLAVLRSPERFAGPESLETATRLATVSSSQRSYQDYPVPGIRYYYVILDAEQLEGGMIEIRLGDNATIRPVELPLGSRVRSLRPLPERYSHRLPLPSLLLSADIETGREIRADDGLGVEKVRLSRQAELAVERLVRAAPQIDYFEREPIVLERHTGDTAKGPASSLKSILDGPFRHRRWNEAEESLRNLLTIPLSDEIRAAVQFYLGQVLFFTDRITEAALQFISAGDVLYRETRDWITESLSRMGER